MRLLEKDFSEGEKTRYQRHLKMQKIERRDRQEKILDGIFGVVLLGWFFWLIIIIIRGGF